MAPGDFLHRRANSFSRSLKSCVDVPPDGRAGSVAFTDLLKAGRLQISSCSGSFRVIFTYKLVKRQPKLWTASELVDWRPLTIIVWATCSGAMAYRRRAIVRRLHVRIRSSSRGLRSIERQRPDARRTPCSTLSPELKDARAPSLRCQPAENSDRFRQSCRMNSLSALSESSAASAAAFFVSFSPAICSIATVCFLHFSTSSLDKP